MKKLSRIKNIYNGFSLIELLIAISLIALLSTLGLYGYNNYNKRAKDVEKKSDLSQYRTQLESFANRNNGLYPAFTTSVNIGSGNLCAASALNLTGSSCPTGSPNLYRYISNGSTGTTATDYLLSVQLESPSTTTYFGLCSDGTTLEQASVALTDCQ